VRAAHEARKSAALLGLAVDQDGDETRLTRGKNFLLLGGSQETHGLLQETAVNRTAQGEGGGSNFGAVASSRSSADGSS
jgi:hypothetical protein